MQAAVSLLPAKYSDRLPFKGVARPLDGYLTRQSLVVGSLSIDRSIGSITTSSSSAFGNGSETPVSSG